MPPLAPVSSTVASCSRIAGTLSDGDRPVASSAMLIEHEGKRPRVAKSAYVAPTAVLCGDVRVGAESRILFGAVLTAESGSIEVGERCIVMENALLRGRDSHPVVLGDHVLVGPHAHVNGARIESEVFLATGVSVFPGARVGRGSEVRINAVVREQPAGGEHDRADRMGGGGRPGRHVRAGCP
jgi:carbonic anhydrase/acetyltransferase-like protein (isoleucine patch superfamily)